MKPFLKWAGGKTNLIENIVSDLPKDKKTYVEPFIGGGSVFLYMIFNNKFEKYIINDINKRLINLYNTIKYDVYNLIDELNKLKEEYNSYEEFSKEREIMYYKIRDLFNSDFTNNIKSASYFLFLNKTCFNGLYRENSKGEFNVPIGKYKNPQIFDSDNLIYISNLLNKKNKKGEYIVTILNESYEKISDYIDENSFVYFDPPYRPITKGGFNSYNKSKFNDCSQKNLCEFFIKMDKKCAKLMLSNSDPKNFDKNDNFFDDLYKDFNIKRVYQKRSINSDSSNRKSVKELLITNY